MLVMQYVLRASGIEEGFPNVALGDHVGCSEFFDDKQCLFVQKEIEKRTNKIHYDAINLIKEISSKFEDKFELKHLEMERKYKRLQRQVLKSAHEENKQQNSWYDNKLSDFRDPFKDEKDDEQYIRSSIWNYETYLEKEGVANTTEEINANKASYKVRRSAGNVRKAYNKWIAYDHWKLIGNTIYDFMTSLHSHEKEEVHKSGSIGESHYYYQNLDQGGQGIYDYSKYQQFGSNSIEHPVQKTLTVIEKVKLLMLKIYDNLIKYQQGYPSIDEKQDLPSIDSFFTQFAQFVTSNTAAIAFVATAGAASNLALNVYQQNAIDNTNADLTTKQHQIAQILSKVSVLEVRVSNMNTVLNANAELASENRKRHTNTDSSLGAICSLLDTLYGSSISGVSAKRCCYVAHKETQVGNFMQCLSTASATLVGITDSGTGTCDQSTPKCHGLATE